MVPTPHETYSVASFPGRSHTIENFSLVFNKHTPAISHNQKWKGKQGLSYLASDIQNIWKHQEKILFLKWGHKNLEKAKMDM